MNRIASLLPGSILISLGLLLIVNTLTEFLPGIESVEASLYILAGVTGVYIYFNSNRKVLLILSVVIFLIGVYNLLLNRFDLLNKSTFAFPVLMIFSGIVFLYLFFDDTKERIFLLLSILSVLIGIMAFKYNYYWYFRFANNLTQLMFLYKEIFLIFIGINFLLSPKKKSESSNIPI